MTILNRKAIPFEVIFKEPIFLLFAVAEVYKYVDGEKTDEVIGYAYEVCDTTNFDKFRVRVLDANKPHIENEEVQAMREAGERVFVEFVGGVDTPYQRTEYKDNTTVRSLEDSFTADAAKISERQTLQQPKYGDAKKYCVPYNKAKGEKMITNVSDIINNIFEKIFENPEISFSHPNRTFQYAVRHGKMNEDYLALNEDTLERKLKTGIAQAIVKEFPACDPDVRVTVFYDDPHEKRVYNVKCSIAIYYSFAERADNIGSTEIVLSEEEGKKLLKETLKRMEDQLGTEIEVAWGYETYCGADWMDTGIVIAGEELVYDPENPDLEEQTLEGYKNLFERSMRQCLNAAFPEQEWEVDAMLKRDKRDEDTFTVNAGIKRVEV